MSSHYASQGLKFLSIIHVQLDVWTITLYYGGAKDRQNRPVAKTDHNENRDSAKEVTCFTVYANIISVNNLQYVDWVW